MNKKLPIFLIFILLRIAALNAQVITGNIIDGLDRDFLDKVWVINLDTQDSSLTNERGYFRVFGNSGDSLLITRTNYIPKKVLVGEDGFVLTEIFLDARTLPRFDLFGDKIVIPFRIGNLSNLRGISSRPAGPGKIYLGILDSSSVKIPSLTLDMTLDGPISYFMKSEKQKREYSRKLALLARQKDYLDFIQSDSVMTSFKDKYQLTDQELNEIIIEFNFQNMESQFLDMDWELIEDLWTEFLDQKTRHNPPSDIDIQDATLKPKKKF